MEKDHATILVVDDERVNRVLLRSLLEKKYDTIIEAEDGIEAISAVKSNDVHIILLDIMMPNMNGFEVLRTLRSHPKFQTIPIVIITALTSLKDNMTALNLGADGFLTKPINSVILEATVKNLLKQYQMQLKLTEAKKAEMYLATVVTANHEINQPLTSILCSTSLLEGLVEGDKLKSAEKFDTYIKIISSAAKDIAGTLEKLRSVKTPSVKTYVDKVQMVDIDATKESPTGDRDADEFALTEPDKKLVLIDEEHDITDLLQDYFKGYGYDVKVFDDYADVKAMYTDDCDSLCTVVIDIKEPDKKGLKLFYELLELNSNLNIILTSAYSLKGDIFEAIKAGAKAFLPKPYDSEDLRFLIERTL